MTSVADDKHNEEDEEEEEEEEEDEEEDEDDEGELNGTGLADKEKKKKRKLNVTKKKPEEKKKKNAIKEKAPRKGGSSHGMRRILRRLATIATMQEKLHAQDGVKSLLTYVMPRNPYTPMVQRAAPLDGDDRHQFSSPENARVIKDPKVAQALSVIRENLFPDYAAATNGDDNNNNNNKGAEEDEDSSDSDDDDDDDDDSADRQQRKKKEKAGKVPASILKKKKKTDSRRVIILTEQGLPTGSAVVEKDMWLNLVAMLSFANRLNFVPFNPSSSTAPKAVAAVKAKPAAAAPKPTAVAHK
jgi:hypothetical protein